MADLISALARLAQFRQSWNAEDEIDEQSGLTAADLDTIIAAAHGPDDLDPGGSLTADDLGNFA